MERHGIASQNPFKCHCGRDFTRLYTLKRHIGGIQKDGVIKFECPDCTAYRGKNGFKRKDHLVQHLRRFHNYRDDQLWPRQARRYDIPVCHFESCEFSRLPEFKEMPIGQQEKNRPFDKQSDYTRHMKEEHDWSPYPSKVPGCGKIDGKGFFNETARVKHCAEKHPGSTNTPALATQKEIAKTVKCDYCLKVLRPSTLSHHQSDFCRGQATCSYCRERMEARQLEVHTHESCRGEVTCPHCQTRMESKQLSQHELKSCTGEACCRYCHKLTERRQLSQHESESCTGEVRCYNCQELVERRQRRGRFDFYCTNCYYFLELRNS